MKSARLTFPAPPLVVDAGPGGWSSPSAMPSAVPSSLPSLIDLLMDLSEWPKDHGIRVRRAGRQTSLTACRVATSRHVIEILFDPSTGRYECTNCQSAGVDLPPSVQGESDGGFVRAGVRGLTAAAATALLQGALALLEIWPHGLPPAEATGPARGNGNGNGNGNDNGDGDGDGNDNDNDNGNGAPKDHDGIAAPSAAGRGVRRKPAV